MGRLTRDPVLRHTQSNTPVTSFTLAVDRFGKSSEQKSADFIDIVCWEKLAEFTANYFVKGQLVSIVGRLQQRQWDDKEGNKRTSYEVVASEAHFAERKQQQPRDDYGNPYATPSQPTPRPNNDYYDNQPAPASQAPVVPATDSTGFTELMEDDGQLPF